MQYSAAHGQFLVQAVDRTLDAMRRRGFVSEEFEITESGKYALAAHAASGEHE